MVQQKQQRKEENHLTRKEKNNAIEIAVQVDTTELKKAIKKIKCLIKLLKK